MNDMIYLGPELQCDLFDSLLHFRCHPVGIFFDIAKMYLRV